MKGNLILHPATMLEMEESYDSFKGESDDNKKKLMELIWLQPVVDEFLTIRKNRNSVTPLDAA
tara:strand:- start:277 stop:465 length:189 start_codon:yes stop_codon:yes gene_type:complete